MKNSHRGVVGGVRVAACVIVAGLVAAACSSGPPTAGKLNVSKTHVKSAQPPDAPSEATSGQSVNPGQVLSTDSTGLAQVTYPDGSLTRLDSDTVFKVVNLTANSGGRQTLGSVSGGKVWNKVTKLPRGRAPSRSRPGVPPRPYAEPPSPSSARAAATATSSR